MSRWLKVTLVLIAITLVGIAGLFYQINSAFNLPLNIVGNKEFVVNKGHFAHYVINRLGENGWVKHPLLVKAALKIEPELANIKSGTYEIKFGMSARELFEILSKGKEKTFDITLVEGLTWADWLTQLNNHPRLTPSAKTAQQWIAFLNSELEGGSIEGWLLADTYQFTQATPVEDIVRRAHISMTQYLAHAWQIRALDLPYQSPYEALIMASIIEKETGVARERPHIASVFVNRLRENMRLQTDPTVIYGMGEAFDGNIRRKDLRQPTPYNTYVIKGLPPTPISMPSRLSIDAALQPLDTTDYYFVSKGDGSHYFSETLDEHNRAVREYQLKKR
ncbi:endolytic transglycosylase MltG [Aliiglaciecola litoralis]|uniref:Endolytic murein transglycosylase n=1 Tax=Aliiglaciecola litoralis TaxID=582857 RepID=A0ABP3WQH7_9ALTE